MQPIATQRIRPNCRQNRGLTWTAPMRVNEIAINWNAARGLPCGRHRGNLHGYFLSRVSLQTRFSRFRGRFNRNDRACGRPCYHWMVDRFSRFRLRSNTISTAPLSMREMFIQLGDHKHSVTLTGLAPATKYYFRLVSADDFDSVTVGHCKHLRRKQARSSTVFSFDPSGLNIVPGTDLTISFKAFQGSSSYVRFSLEETPRVNIIACNENSGTIRRPFPAQTSRHREYSFRLRLRTQRTAYTTPIFALSASAFVQISDTLQFARLIICCRFRFFKQFSKPLDWLGAQLGDTSTWRYYGYNSQTGKYVFNDTIQGGQGKWL